MSPTSEPAVRPTRSATLVIALTAVLASACGASEQDLAEPPGDESDGGLDATVDGTDADQPVDDGGQGDGELSLEAATEAAVADLAATEGTDPTAIEVIAAEEVTWSDGALGCPEPDGMYTQALVPGYRILLASGDTEVHYHAATTGEPFRCDDPQPPAEG